MASTIGKPPNTEARNFDTSAASGPLGRNYFAIDVGLRVFLFATSLTALVVMSTAKQTELSPVPGMPGVRLPVEAKFSHSPAFIYFIAALSVTALYSIITTLSSLGAISKPIHATKLLLHYALWDVLALGIVVAATGSAGAVAYIGLKGNSHTGWTKVCNIYDTFCRHVGSAVALSLIASVVLIFLIMLSVCSLYSRIPKA